MSDAASADDLAAALAALADGIIPPDARDAGAGVVNAGRRLAERVAAGVNATLYRAGVETAETLARQRDGRSVAALDATELHELIGRLRAAAPAFYKQLRMDVSALYLSDPGVWSRIGFPGPSTAAGGYPDFDQPQSRM
jgi:hypothetical protein